MADIPHFAVPFQFAGTTAAVVEQDSIEEIAYCTLVVLSCPLGFRVELPEFGLPDLTFTYPLDADQIAQTIQEWEPRALIHFSRAELSEMSAGLSA